MLIFHPNTRLLSSASVSGGEVLKNEEVAEFLEERLGDRDVPALVAGVLAMARAKVASQSTLG
jgi:hypothetical protein